MTRPARSPGPLLLFVCLCALSSAMVVVWSFPPAVETAAASQLPAEPLVATPAETATARPQPEPPAPVISPPAAPDRTILLQALRALELKMQIHQDNLANVLTVGFKRSTVQTVSRAAHPQRIPGTADRHALIGTGSDIGPISMDHRQGALRSTGRSLDVAIDGPGFLQVTTAAGGSAFTRDGALQVDAEGRLGHRTGAPLTPPILLPKDLLEIAIDGDGRVMGRTATSPDTLHTFGQIRLARFRNPSRLARGAGNTFRETKASGPATPATPDFGTIHQTFLERSNVDKSTELFELQSTQTLYESTRRILLGG